MVRRILLLGLVAACAAPSGLRLFPDRPVAWQEHDDGDTPRPAASPRWEKARAAHTIRESVVRRVDDALAMRTLHPAADVNALDEVPCSTWFCPRVHLGRLAALAVAAGPPGEAPTPPLTIEKKKEAGASAGARVVDARGRKYLLKVDVKPWTNLSVGAELVGARLFWAAGYNVAPSWALDLTPADLRGDPEAVRQLFETGARTRSGKLRALAVAWIDGEILGGFDFQGRRKGDRNDRIPHQDRRSLRASWILFAWTNYGDPSSANTVDSWVREGGRRFVRHYIVDFGSTLGAWTISPKPPKLSHRSVLVAAMGHDPQASWRRDLRRHPAIGHLSDDGWDPGQYKSLLRNPAHVARTPADEYWGAKVVTAFSDAQIAAAVAAAGYDHVDADLLVYALRVRRDIIGRRYLAPATAVERPIAGNGLLCFDDLAITRGYARDVTYRLRWIDARGRTVSSGRARAAGPRSCLPAPARGYHVLELASGRRPARIHLKDGRVVGLEHE